MELNPRDAASWGNLGAALRRLRRVEEAIAAYEQALVALPDNPDLLNNYAVALRQAGRPEEAIAALEAALARTPDAPDVHLNLAIAYRSLQRFAEAAREYEAWYSVTPAPTDPGPLFDLGFCYEQTNRRDDAVRIYRVYQGLVSGRDQAGADRVAERLGGLNAQ